MTFVYLFIIYKMGKNTQTKLLVLIPELYVSHNGPRITPCAIEVLLHSGQNYTLKCQADTPVKFIQDYDREEQIGSYNYTQRSVEMTNESAEYKYETYLELLNVDRYAIRYYACIRTNTSVDENVFSNLVEEPNNSKNISYIYIYVDGENILIYSFF